MIQNTWTFSGQHFVAVLLGPNYRNCDSRNEYTLLIVKNNNVQELGQLRIMEWGRGQSDYTGNLACDTLKLVNMEGVEVYLEITRPGEIWRFEVRICGVMVQK